MSGECHSAEAICPECGQSMELVKKGTISAGYRCSKHGYFVQMGSSLLSLTPRFTDGLTFRLSASKN